MLLRLTGARVRKRECLGFPLPDDGVTVMPLPVLAGTVQLPTC